MEGPGSGAFLTLPINGGIVVNVMRFQKVGIASWRFLEQLPGFQITGADMDGDQVAWLARKVLATELIRHHGRDIFFPKLLLPVLIPVAGLL